MATQTLEVIDETEDEASVCDECGCEVREDTTSEEHGACWCEPCFDKTHRTCVTCKGVMHLEHRSYFVWEYGKTPEAVVEIVSNKVGGETTDKMLKYAQINVVYYAIYDPDGHVQFEPLKVFVLREKSYVPCSPEWLPALGLGLTLWRGPFESCDAVWLRWCDRQGRVIPTGAERAEHERLRAERLAARLRELGVDPDEG